MYKVPDELLDFFVAFGAMNHKYIIRIDPYKSIVVSTDKNKKVLKTFCLLNRHFLPNVYKVTEDSEIIYEWPEKKRRR